jgi:hypothetical protein
MNPRILNSITYAALSLGVVFTTVSLAHDGAGGASLRSDLALWSLLPYAVLLLSTLLARSSRKAFAALSVAILCSASALFYYGQAVFTHPTYLNGIIFAILPTYQVIPAAILLAVLFFTRASNANRNV